MRELSYKTDLCTVVSFAGHSRCGGHSHYDLVTSESFIAFPSLWTTGSDATMRAVDLAKPERARHRSHASS